MIPEIKDRRSVAEASGCEFEPGGTHPGARVEVKIKPCTPQSAPAPWDNVPIPPPGVGGSCANAAPNE